MKNSKGQAAIEYLMNYSWALLAVTVLLVLLFSTGVFNPTQFVMEECYIGPSLSCAVQTTTTPAGDTKLLMRITNPMGYPIQLDTVTFSSEWMPGHPFRVVGDILNNSQSYVITGASGFTLGAKSDPGTVRRLTFNVTYYICAEEFGLPAFACDTQQRMASGRIVTKVI